ncbi:nitroreductase family protein [Nocardioides sp.]|uniref:nitroreductase family protein n=1 Tax=Nocardioides sp. TaxID=35761 RepID=UPI003528BA9E
MEFQDVVRRRRMIRRYDPDRAVPPELVDRILDNATRAPSAGFSQGWGFLVLEGSDQVARFRDACTPAQDADRWFAANVEAPLVVVPHSNKSAYLDRYAEQDKGFTDRSDAWWPAPYWDIDTGFASLMMLLTAVDADLGACFFGIPVDRIDVFRDAFGVPAEFHPIGAVSIGYPDDPLQPGYREAVSRRRKSTDVVVHRGSWGEG